MRTATAWTDCSGAEGPTRADLTIAGRAASLDDVDVLLGGSGFHHGSAAVDLAEAGRAAVSRVSGRFGLVRRIDEVPLAAGRPRAHIRIARGPMRLAAWPFLHRADGTGVSTDPAHASVAAVAEAVERYASMAPMPSAAHVRAAWSQLGDRALRPSSFALMSARQLRRIPKVHPFTDTTVVDWVPVQSLTRDRAVLAPAALMYLTCRRQPPNDVVGEVTSTGTAAHVAVPDAILAALCEVLERDAVTIAWYNRLPLRRLDTAHTEIDSLLKEVFDGCAGERYLFDVPTDSPFPVVLALSWSSDSRPHAAVAAACRPDHLSAAKRTVFELAQVLARLHARSPRRPERIRTFDDHADLFAEIGPATILRDTFQTSGTVALGELTKPADVSTSSRLAGAVTSLKNVGLEVLVNDLTTFDVALAGFRVVRVVVPGTVDMSADARFARLGGSRLYELPVRLGLRARTLSEDELNPMPVPLA